MPGSSGYGWGSPQIPSLPPPPPPSQSPLTCASLSGPSSIMTQTGGGSTIRNLGRHYNNSTLPPPIGVLRGEGGGLTDTTLISPHSVTSPQQRQVWHCRCHPRREHRRTQGTSHLPLVPPQALPSARPPPRGHRWTGTSVLPRVASGPALAPGMRAPPWSTQSIFLRHPSIEVGTQA